MHQKFSQTNQHGRGSVKRPYGPLLIAVMALVLGVLMSPTQLARAASDVERGQLTWSDCSDETSPTRQCATLEVPLDYDRPNRGTVALAMARVPASGPNPIGSLFFNPGGPGGSGTAVLDYDVSQMSEDMKERFHIVSWDPRGVGQTTPKLESCDNPFPVLPATGK